MPATVKEVQQLVHENFPDSDINEITEEFDRITGIIRSQEFAGKDGEARNKLVREKVRDVLKNRGLNVGFLLPVAPGEQL